jgi:hypothetical protein
VVVSSYINIPQCLQFAVNHILIHENIIQLSAKVIFCTRNTEVDFRNKKYPSPCSFIRCQHAYVLCDLLVKIKGNLVRMDGTEENIMFIHVWAHVWVGVGCKWIKLWGFTWNIMHTKVIKASVCRALSYILSTRPTHSFSENPPWKTMHLSHHLTLHWNMCYKPFLSF